MFEGGFIF